MTEPIPRHILAAAARSLRFQVLAMLNRAVAEAAVTDEQLAGRLGWSVNRVRHTLAGRRKLTLRDIGEMAFAIDGSVVDFHMEPK